MRGKGEITGIELADPPLFPPIDGNVAVGIVIKIGVGAVEVVLFFVDSDGVLRTLLGAVEHALEGKAPDVEREDLVGIATGDEELVLPLGIGLTRHLGDGLLAWLVEADIMVDADEGEGQQHDEGDKEAFLLPRVEPRQLVFEKGKTHNEKERNEVALARNEAVANLIDDAAGHQGRPGHSPPQRAPSTSGGCGCSRRG